ncbi:hypothetical protein BSL78_30322 [Apostichopus japonicus]|uniref:Uncharacterized protein n=1 Tax=Stichopus japonicus TaxID=307972 RepID=A0A2G8JAU8_STIJA|nr:hypothetical protein BSL78_30322 [Apostichopus japonicus]
MRMWLCEDQSLPMHQANIDHLTRAHPPRAHPPRVILQDASGSFHEQHNPIYQSTDVPAVHQRQAPIEQPIRIPARESNQRVPAQTSEDFIHKYTILQPDDIEERSGMNPPIASPQENPKVNSLEPEHLLEFNPQSDRQGPLDVMQTANIAGFGWRSADPKNPNSYMETEI